MKITKSNAIPIIILVFVNILVNYFILFRPGIIINGDIKFPWNFSNFIESSRYLFFDKIGSVSGLEVMSWSNNYRLILEFVNFFQLGTEGYEKIQFSVTSLFSLISFYFFCIWISRQIIKKNINKYFLCFVSIFFTFNPWVLNQIQAWGFWIAYIITPLVIKNIYEWLEYLKLKNLVWIVFLTSIFVSGPQFLFFTFILFLIIFTYFLTIKGKTLLFNFKLYKQIIFGIILFSLINFSWIFTIFGIYTNKLLITTGYGYGKSEVSPELIFEFSKNSNLINTFRGYDQWVRWFNLDIKSNFQIIISFLPVFLIPVSLILLKKHRNKFIYLIVLLTLFFGTLALGPKIPGYVSFATWKPVASTFGFALRTTYKLSYFLFIGYSILLIYIYSAISSNSRKFFVFIIFLYFVSVPLVKTIGYFWKYYTPIPQPLAYKKLYSYIDQNLKEDASVRTVWLAPYLTAFHKNALGWETSFTWNPEELAQHTPETSGPTANISYYHLTYKDWLMNFFYKIQTSSNFSVNNIYIPPDIGKKYLSIVNARWLVYHNDIVNGKIQGLKELALLDKSDLKKVAEFSEELNGGKIVLYENPYKKSFFRNEKDEVIPFTKENPTKYNLIINKQKKAITSLIFDRYWMLYLPKARKTIKPVIYKINDIPFTSFDIPNNYAGKAELIYLPQKYYDIGRLIGTPIFILTFLYLVFGNNIKNIYEKLFKK